MPRIQKSWRAFKAQLQATVAGISAFLFSPVAAEVTRLPSYFEFEVEPPYVGCYDSYERLPSELRLNERREWGNPSVSATAREQFGFRFHHHAIGANRVNVTSIKFFCDGRHGQREAVERGVNLVQPHCRPAPAPRSVSFRRAPNTARRWQGFLDFAASLLPTLASADSTTAHPDERL